MLNLSCDKVANTKVADTKIAYTKEISYLPSQKDMTVQSVQKPVKNGLGMAKYVLKNQTTKEALTSYGDLLKKDGWKITVNKAQTLITAEKATHRVTIIPTQVNKDVQLTVVSK